MFFYGRRCPPALGCRRTANSSMCIVSEEGIMEQLTLDTLKTAVAGRYAAIRRITRLQPADGAKVFPPTYEGGEYAFEPRKVRMLKGVADVSSVLLDSVQSQSNRMELALQRAYDENRLKFPFIQVDFMTGETNPVLAEIRRVTALEAPHRIADAIFRDAVYEGTPFRQSQFGQKLDAAKTYNATPIFELCPTALLFGFWDSTGPKGGLGAKVQRAIVSEIVGHEAVPGVRPSSRIDPLQIENNVDIYRKAGGGWTLNEDEAERNSKGELVKLRPSEINHGNVTPSLRHEDDRTRKQVLNHGGVTIAEAVQTTVLSLAALRRLRFPLNGSTSPQADIAARTVLAALGLAAICLLQEEGYDLRSRCLLDGKPGAFEFVGRGESLEFSLESDEAAVLIAEAAVEAKAIGLPWPEEPITLQPSPELKQLIIKSREKAVAAVAK